MDNPRVFMDIRIGTKPAGRMVFELFADTTPKTVENFRCLCTGEKGKGKKTGKPLHYKNTIFHRVIGGFMAQGGDFSKFNGTGGESIYGGEFEDENFIRKHIGPGMLSMANAGPNTNGSQFFITFRSAPHLNGKHCVFGRLVDGLSLLRDIEVLRCGQGNKPIQEVCITNCGMESAFAATEEKETAKKPAADNRANDEEIELSDDSSSDDDSDDEDEEDEKDEENKPAAQAPVPTFANPRQQKLFELRLRLNKCRKSNHREVVAERKRLSSTNSSKEVRKEWLAKRENWKAELEAQGENPEHGFLHETAESAGKKIKKKNKKRANQAAFGWNVFNQDAKYKAYKKRLKSITQTANTDFRDVNSLDFAQDVQPSPEQIQGMVDELEACDKRRQNYSRRRPVYEGQDITHINERNRVFNKKAARAFDKYTKEIRANLERGTAL